MATDKYAGDLTQKTAATLNGYEQFIMFDTTEGKRAYLGDVATFIGGSINAMTVEEAEAGSVTEKRFVAPQVFRDSTLSIVNEDEAILSSETVDLWKEILGITEE